MNYASRSFCLLVILLGSCSKVGRHIPRNAQMIGHGGMGISSQYPMNSLESFRNALALGADGIEVDVQLTRDSILVAFKEEYLQETTGLSGSVSETDLQDLQGAFYTDFPHTRYGVVPVTDIFAAAARWDDPTIVLDCKLFDADDEFKAAFATAIQELIETHDMLANCIVESTDIQLLQLVKSRQQSIVCFYYVPDFETGFDHVLQHQIEGITIRHNLITAEQAAQARENGISTAVFNVRNVRDLESNLSKEVDYIQVDNLRTMLKAL